MPHLRLATLYLGLDVHECPCTTGCKRYVYAVAVDVAGRKQSSGRLNNDRITLQRYVGSLPDRVQIVMEACFRCTFGLIITD